MRLGSLYSMLTSKSPLRPQLPSSCPTELATLVCLCWDADPPERPTFINVCCVLRYLKGAQTMECNKSVIQEFDFSHKLFLLCLHFLQK